MESISAKTRLNTAGSHLVLFTELKGLAIIQTESEITVDMLAPNVCELSLTNT